MKRQGKNFSARTSAIQDKDNYPSYRRLLKSGELEKRVEEAYKRLESCNLCPWRCGVNRLKNEKRGVCRSGLNPMVSSYNLHFGEEPVLSGTRGSGTIFFTNCTLRCVFCQNFPISQLGAGKEYSVEELAEMMLELQAKGAHNINFVTPSHFIAQILKATLIAAEKGLSIPLVYNTSGYDAVDALRLLDGVVDIYLPDIKYSDNRVAKKYSRAKNCVEVNRAALKEMHRQVGDLVVDEEGIAVRGLIIRHLVLPNGLAGTKEAMEFIAKELSPNTVVSLMSQYFPAHKAHDYPELSRSITAEEYLEAIKYLEEAGLRRGWIQERTLFVW